MDGMRLVRISSRSGADRAVKGSIAALVCVVAVSSCSGQSPAPRADDLCSVAESSDEAAALRQIIGSGDYETQVDSTTDGLTSRLKKDLRERKTDDWTTPADMCSYVPANQSKPHRVRVEFGWTPPAGAQGARPAVKDAGRYEVNGALIETDDIASLLRIRCDLPGGLGAPSKQVLLYGDVSYSINISRTDIDQAARDRQTTFAYLMTRRVTDALGCENKPLEKPPVVKPAPTP